MKKRIKITILSILITSIILPQATTHEQTTLYVNDDNTSGPWDGSLLHPYQHIQDGIDAAEEHDIVFVFSGVYNEHIHINLSIQLIGEHEETTMISSNDTADIIQIYDTSSVTLRNFYIQHTYSSSEYLAGIHLKNTSYSLIENITIKNCYDGVLLKGHHNYLKNMSISENKIGICFGHYRSITNDNDNLVQLNIHLYSHTTNFIKNNEINKNFEAGIDLSFTTQNTIEGNTFSDNNYGVRFRSSSNNEIHSNNFINNTIHAFAFDESLNSWHHNYWDNWIGIQYLHLAFLPKIIPSFLGINIDWEPAESPYF